MNTTKEETLGQRIKAQRRKLGMTQDELAERLYIPKSTISAYENDKIDIKASRLAELARTLGTTPDYLLGFEDEKEADEDLDETIAAVLGCIKDEKVKRMLLAQIRVATEIYLY